MIFHLLSVEQEMTLPCLMAVHSRLGRLSLVDTVDLGPSELVGQLLDSADGLIFISLFSQIKLGGFNHLQKTEG